MNKNNLMLAIATYLLSGIPSLCVAQHVTAKPGWNLNLGLYAHAGISDVNYSDSSQLSPAKDKINDEHPTYYTGNISIDPSYLWENQQAGIFQLKLHMQIQLEDAWLDNDRIDELSIALISKRYGTLYLGEDDGAADKMKSPQAGRVGIAIGHNGPRGIISWWGNLPYAGGFDRNDLFDWSNGIVSGDWRAFERDTHDAIKIGYLSPKLKGWRFGASINLRDTYAGFNGKGSAPSKQDRWDDLRIRDDEFELAANWHGKTTQGWMLDGGMTHVSVHSVNKDVLQVNTDGGFKVGKQLKNGATVSASAYYARQKYTAHRRNSETGRQMHLGIDWSKEKWKVGLNYFRAWESWNPTYTVKLGGGGNEGYSVGIDYQAVKGLVIGMGIIDARNESGEEAIEVGMNFTYRYKTLLN